MHRRRLTVKKCMRPFLFCAFMHERNKAEIKCLVFLNEIKKNFVSFFFLQGHGSGDPDRCTSSVALAMGAPRRQAKKKKRKKGLQIIGWSVVLAHFVLQPVGSGADHVASRRFFTFGCLNGGCNGRRVEESSFPFAAILRRSFFFFLQFRLKTRK